MRPDLPSKLDPDAILEAVLELRFSSSANLLPEVSLARLVDAPPWSGFQQARLPTADLPQQMRATDPNLFYQPSVQLTAPDGSATVRLGQNALIYIRKAPYPRWPQFKAELDSAVEALFNKISGVEVKRIGLRYVNALTSDQHRINNVQDIDIDISLGRKLVSERFNLNFKTVYDNGLEALSRIATADLVTGAIPPATTLVVDIDVSTTDKFSSGDPSEIKATIDAAHNREKEIFFEILGPLSTKKLSGG